MQLIIIGFFLFKALKLIAATCVLESEFGFILNCNFKKSGLFRVRNLGGLKAHFGLGFSIGDELGFGESLGNLEGNRRRALNYKTGLIDKVGVLPHKIESSTIASSHFDHVRSLGQNRSSMTEVMFLPLGVPTFRPIPKTNNLVRRNDDFLNSKINSNIVMLNSANHSLSMEKEKPFIAKIDKSIQVNMSSSASKNINNIDPHDTYNIYETQKPNGHQFFTEKQRNKPQSTKMNKILAKKNLDNNWYKDDYIWTVMNAPKEYYPSGYDKNFDDNFKSKVGLPPTNFTCAEQKYFPGLYANLDLGCMVFHVCAITDGGIVMKSFLCPESTLFDQTILKCNWWFYVDCNNSTYESNLPISKSYQLMKSLSYFSNLTMI